MTSAYPNIPAPGVTSPTQTFGSGGSATSATQDKELLYSTAGFTQKGVTVAAGQGILPIGTVLGQKTSDKLWYVYDNNGSGGIATARGVLRRAVDTGTDSAGATQQANIVIHGILKNDLVSGADSAALTDLGARKDTVLNTFTF